MCIYCFMFFANELSLAVYFICILDYGNARQIANSGDFFTRFQNGS